MKCCYFYILPVLILCILMPIKASEENYTEEIDKGIKNIANIIHKKIDEKNIIVSDFLMPDGKKSFLGSFISEVLITQLYIKDKTKFKIIERARLQNILKEQEIQISGLVKDESLVKLGNFTGAKVIILGTIFPVKDKVTIAYKAADIETSEILYAGKETVENYKNFKNLLDKDSKQRKIVEKKKSLNITISGGPSKEDPILVDDDLEIIVDNKIVFTDNDGIASWDDRGANYYGDPIHLSVNTNSLLQIIVYDVVAKSWYIGNLYLHFNNGKMYKLMSGKSGRSRYGTTTLLGAPYSPRYYVYNKTINLLKIFSNKTSLKSSKNIGKVLQVKSIKASSVQKEGWLPEGDTFKDLEPIKIIDGDLSTRWASSFKDNQWILLDLGKIRKINRIWLCWEFSYADSYKVEVSKNKRNWYKIYSKDNLKKKSRNFDITDIKPVTARYIRIKLLKRATEWGFSIWEIKIYGE